MFQAKFTSASLTLYEKTQGLQYAHSIIYPLPEDYRPPRVAFSMLASMATIFFGPPSKLFRFS